MLTESERRAAALAVIRYGVDRLRVKEAARSVQRAQAEGRQADVIGTLLHENLLSATQAEQIRLELGKTQIDLKSVAARPAVTTAPSPAPAEEPRAAGPEPRRLGDYQILRRLGEGGMGAVFLGYQEKTGRHVAIKVLSDQLAGNAAYVDRFKREARSVLYLDHPNIVRGFEVGEDRSTGAHFLVLEYVDGPSAHALLDRFGKLPLGDAVHIILDIARALEHAHSRNVIHRDIKPDNILLTRSGVAKLADLGLARRIDETSQLTGARQSFGTPFYMPYEQAANARRADARSDIYALGATLYHLVTGELPFPGDNPLEVAEKKRLGDLPLPSSFNPEIPPALDQILTTMLAPAPKQRYQTASDLIVDLERSKLATAVPSFVDPDIALQDPLVRERLTTQPVPTRLDLASQALNRLSATPDPDVWYLRYRNAQGKWRKARLSTEQVRQRLADGRLSPSVEAAHDAKGEFRTLETYAEFQQIAMPAAPPRKPARQHTEPLSAVNGRAQHRWSASILRRHALWLLPASVMLIAALAWLSYYLLS
jgi:serine/threonine protein kinase